MKRATVASPPGMYFCSQEVSVHRKHFTAEVEGGTLEDLTDLNTWFRGLGRGCHEPLKNTQSDRLPASSWTRRQLAS